LEQREGGVTREKRKEDDDEKGDVKTTSVEGGKRDEECTCSE
jgi:hypothetical protein